MIEGPFPPTLELALDNARMMDALASVVSERLGSRVQITELAIEHIERRIVRYTAYFDGSANNNKGAWSCLGKVYNSQKPFEHNLHITGALVKHGFSGDDGIKIPRLLGSVPELNMILLEEVPGKPLRPLVKNMIVTRDAIRLLARAMIKFHSSPVKLDRLFTIESQLAACNPSPEVLAQTYPDLAEKINTIVTAAKAVQHGFSEESFTLIHGDFHPGQVLLDQDQLYILDLDQVRSGDPAYDLAKLFTFFKRTAKKKKLAGYIYELRDAFIKTYFPATDWEIARRIPLYEALVNLKRACKCLRVQDEHGWEEKLKVLVDQGAACIRAMQTTPERLDFGSVVQLYQRIPGSV